VRGSQGCVTKLSVRVLHMKCSVVLVGSPTARASEDGPTGPKHVRRFTDFTFEWKFGTLDVYAL
jgi:hypothetical protein